MREILFRGKRIDNGEWVEGYYFRSVGRDIIVAGCEHIVDSSTIGQYTGLTDKNGKKIFDGDICKVIFDQYYFTGYREIEFTAKVEYDKGCFFFDNEDGGLVCDYECDEIEIIGNIYDNPELLRCTR